MKNLNKNITKRKQNNNFIVYIHKQRLGLPEQYDMQQAIPKIAYARTETINNLKADTNLKGSQEQLNTLQQNSVKIANDFNIENNKTLS